MEIITIISFMLAGAFSMKTSEIESLEELVHFVNNVEKSTWTAAMPEKYVDLSAFKSKLGVMKGKSPVSLPALNRKLTKEQEAAIPDEFDARTAWPQCPSIGHIRDQSSCDSSWAFGAVGAISDRICIHQGINVTLAAADVLSCCLYCGNGCNGGFAEVAWQYWADNGVVSGGDFSSEEGCMPYPLPPCEHYGTVGPRPTCPEQTPTPICNQNCRAGYAKSYAQDKHFGGKTFTITSGKVAEIQQEIMTNGPVQAVFKVYEDFRTYKSGIYQHRTGQFLGKHAIRIIGWGAENGTPYWLIANSWNTDWAEQGYLRILRGSNECGIEQQIIAGFPRAYE